MTRIFVQKPPRRRPAGRRSGGAILVAIATACLFCAVLFPSSLPASAGAVDTSVKHWWQYDPSMWGKGWPSVPSLVKEHRQWHNNHPHAGTARHDKFHKELARQFRQTHYHRALSDQTGDATWYNANGQTGACGHKLHGMYVAHRHWPCGSLVSVRSGNNYVFVHVEDRGPFGHGRIVDLSKKAFRVLAPPSQGVIQNVTAVRLKKK